MTNQRQIVWCLYSDGPCTDGSDVYASPPQLFTSMEGALRYLQQVDLGEESFSGLLWWKIRDGLFRAWNPEDEDNNTIHLSEDVIDEHIIRGHGYSGSPSIMPEERVFTDFETFYAEYSRRAELA